MDSRVAFIAVAPVIASTSASAITNVFATSALTTSQKKALTAARKAFVSGSVPLLVNVAKQFAVSRHFEIRADSTFDALKAASAVREGKGKFGMVQFAELFNGRAAMLGFVLGLVTEYLTGEGIFEQIGLVDPKDQLLFLLALTTGSALSTLVGFVLYKKQQQENRLNKY